jgi:glycosyltransferase involved in cell wall biosynthesis
VTRALLIAEAANPEWTSVPLVGWSHARALMGLLDAHLVTQVRNRDAIIRAGLPEQPEFGGFTAIDSERFSRPLWRLAGVLRGGSGKGWTMVTALSALSYYWFEHLVWWTFGARIEAGEYDVVHRLTPLSPTVPSLIASRCRRAGVPFVLGPLNGGVPWPREFGGARRKEREWLSYVRGLHRLMPGYGATRRNASAILIGSRDTWSQMPRWALGKCVYLPENGVDPAKFAARRAGRRPGPLRAVFVGRLVPYKGPDMLVEAAAPLVRAGTLELTIVGDGPLMGELRAMVEREGIGGGVTLTGWVEQGRVQDHLVDADVFAFPSIREFGGAVVLEAMALGVVPIVVDYGGPADLVTPSTGFSVPIASRRRIVEAFRDRLSQAGAAPGSLERMRTAAMARVDSQFTWEAKARQVEEVYRWVLGQRSEKPDFGMPLREPGRAAVESVPAPRVAAVGEGAESR